MDRLAPTPTDSLIAAPDTLIVPFTELLDSPRGLSDHRGGPIWPDWDRQREARHLRHGRTIDAPPEPVETGRVIEESLAWAGPLTRNYGHQVAEFSMRLLPTTLAAPGARIAFASSPRFRIERWEDAPPFFFGILDWFDIPLARCELITRPVLARDLVVMPQAEPLRGPGPSEAHLDLMDAHTARKLQGRKAEGRVVYVSRAAQASALAGEVQLESALRAAGMSILRPETLPIEEQVRHYHSAELLVFAEGSALHTLQLAGRLRAEVVVLVRRPGFKQAVTSLEPRIGRLRYVEVAEGLVHGLRPSGGPSRERGICIPAEEALLSTFDALGIHARSAWQSRAFRSARDDAVRAWVARERRLRQFEAPGSLEMVMGTLHDAGLDHLEADVRRLMTDPASAPGRSAGRLERLRARLARKA